MGHLVKSVLCEDYSFCLKKSIFVRLTHSPLLCFFYCCLLLLLYSLHTHAGPAGMRLVH